MKPLFRCRVDAPTLKRVEAVTETLGTSPGDQVRILFAEIARTGRSPLKMDANAPAELLDKARRNRVLRDLDDSEGW